MGAANSCGRLKSLLISSQSKYYKTVTEVMTDGEILDIALPSSSAHAMIIVSTSTNNTNGIAAVKIGGGPYVSAVSGQANFAAVNSDFSTPPASGTGVVSVGRSATGVRVHAGLATTVHVMVVGG